MNNPISEATTTLTTYTPEWVPATVDQVKAGQTVRLEHGDGSVLVRTVLDHGFSHGLTIQVFSENPVKQRFLRWLAMNGWSLFVQATPKPEVKLPTAPDTVIRITNERNRYWLAWLGFDGLWDVIDPKGDAHRQLETPLSVVDDFERFDVLAPLADTAKQIIDKVDELREQGVWTIEGVKRRLAAEFGVTDA